MEARSSVVTVARHPAWDTGVAFLSMDDLFSLFYDKVYCSGFLQRRIYQEPDGRRPTTIEVRDWRRVYVELKGPLLRCWRASACDADSAMIERLKREALSSDDIELEPIDLRMAMLEPLEDYRLERTLFNAFSINYSAGLNKVHFQAPNSTAVREWKAAIVKASREALLLDQRYSVRIQMSPETPLYSDTMLPEPSKILLKWPGSMRWKEVWLAIEAKRGFLHRHRSSSLKMRCIYIYEDEAKRHCIGRLGSVTAVYAMHMITGDLDNHDFVIEAIGKQKSSSLEGLKATERAWMRSHSREVMIKWIVALRNAFEIVTPNGVVASATGDLRNYPEIVLAERRTAQSVGTHSVGSSFGSNQSISTGTPAEPLINRLRRPWDAQHKIRPRSKTLSIERGPGSDASPGVSPSSQSNYSVPITPTLPSSSPFPTQSQLPPGNFMAPPPMSYPMIASPYGFPHLMTPPPYYHQTTPYFSSYLPSMTPDQLRWTNQLEQGEGSRGIIQKNFFISQVYTLIMVKPYSSVNCDDLYRAYERHCLRCAQRPAAPVEVNEWMREMGFVQIPPQRGEALAWQHVTFKKDSS